MNQQKQKQKNEETQPSSPPSAAPPAPPQSADLPLPGPRDWDCPLSGSFFLCLLGTNPNAPSLCLLHFVLQIKTLCAPGANSTLFSPSTVSPPALFCAPWGAWTENPNHEPLFPVSRAWPKASLHCPRPLRVRAFTGQDTGWLLSSQGPSNISPVVTRSPRRNYISSFP